MPKKRSTIACSQQGTLSFQSPQQITAMDVGVGADICAFHCVVPGSGRASLEMVSTPYQIKWL